MPDASDQEWHQEHDFQDQPWGSGEYNPPEPILEAIPHKLTETRYTRYPKPGTFIPTAHTWISHGGSPKPFVGHFITDVNYTMLPRSYLTHFYVFEDATTPQILLSYAASEGLGILEFKVPNLVAYSHIDALTIPTSPTSGGLRNTAKSITFHDPLMDLDQPCHTFPHSGLRKTAKSVHFSDPENAL